MSNKITELAKEAYLLKEQVADLEAKRKAANKRLTQILESELPDVMNDQEVTSVKIEGVGTVFLQSDVRTNVLKENREQMFEWFKEHGHEDLIVPWVFPQTQKAFVKEQLNEGVELPDFFQASFFTKAQIRKS